jgi:hypothetical protein
MKLTATIARDFTFHAPLPRPVPAGTAVTFYAGGLEDSNRCVFVSVAGRPRVTAVLPKSELIPA